MARRWVAMPRPGKMALEGAIGRLIAHMQAISLDPGIIRSKEVADDITNLKEALRGAQGCFVRLKIIDWNAAAEQKRAKWYVSGLLEKALIPEEALILGSPDLVSEASDAFIEDIRRSLKSYKIRFKLMTPKASEVSINLAREVAYVANGNKEFCGQASVELLIWRKATEEELKLFLRPS